MQKCFKRFSLRRPCDIFGLNNTIQTDKFGILYEVLTIDNLNYIFDGIVDYKLLNESEINEIENEFF